MEFLLFNLIPFIFFVALPAFTIPIIIQFITHSKYQGKSLLIFSISIVILSFIANLLWNTFIFNKVYYEWDRIILPFTLFTHESPLLDGNGTWIADEWTLQGLHYLWFCIVLIIYTLSAVISLLFKEKSHNDATKLILLSYITLLLISSLGLI